jgi:hypothetical protein
MTLVYGTDHFTLDSMGDLEGETDGVERWRNGRFHSRLECDDPRVAGEMTSTWNTDVSGGAANGAMVQWGTSRLANSGGEWVGTFSGVYTSATRDVLAWWLTGEGDYEGLSMYLWEPTTSTSGTAQFRALIFPGSPPTP